MTLFVRPVQKDTYSLSLWRNAPAGYVLNVSSTHPHLNSCCFFLFSLFFHIFNLFFSRAQRGTQSRACFCVFQSLLEINGCFNNAWGSPCHSSAVGSVGIRPISLPYVGIVPETVALAEHQHPCTSICLLYVVSDNLCWVEWDELC